MSKYQIYFFVALMLLLTGEVMLDASEVSSETAIDTASSEQSTEISEVVSENSQLTVEEELSQVSEDSATNSKVSKRVATTSQSTAVETTAAKFTGWKDQRVNGTGVKSEYVDGVLTRYIEYKNNVIVLRNWYYPNGNLKLKRTYYYDSKTGTYSNKQMYKYNEQGRYIDYNAWYSNGVLSANYDYVSSGARPVKKVFYDKNGKVTEVYKYDNNRRLVDQKGYFSNGKIKYDYNFNSSGVRTVQREYTSNGNLLFYRNYYSSGKIKTSLKYDNKLKYRYNEYNSNSILNKQTYYYSNGKVKKINQYDSNGNRTKIEQWSSKGLKTDYKCYDSSGKMYRDYDYHSNGKVSKKKFYYSNGALKEIENYNTSEIKLSEEKYYTNGKVAALTENYDNGNLYRYQTWSSNGMRTYYKINNTSGRIKTEYLSYYTNGKPIQKFDYSYYSNGIIKKIIRKDYTMTGAYSLITSSYNTSGRKIDETLTASSPISYFKVPMKNGYITCQYKCYDGHSGIDFGNINKTTAIYATAPGTVVQTTSGCSATGGYLGNSCNYGAGNYVVISHMYKGKRYFSLYEHLSKINVKVGQKVTSSTKVGNMGLSGNTSGPHLHFELFEDTDQDGLRSDEYRTNPAIFVDLSGEEIKIW